MPYRARPKEPTQAEFSLIASDVFIAKQYAPTPTPPDNIQTTYNKWINIWNDKKLFTINNMNPELFYRAIAISIPMFFVDDQTVVELNHIGYVVGTVNGTNIQGGTQILQIEQITWK